MSSDEQIDDVTRIQNIDDFNLKHPSQRLFPDKPKTPADLLMDIEERDRRLINILAALPSPIAYELLQSVAGNRDDLTLEGIASRCGISRRTLYRLLVVARSVARGDTPPPGIGSSKTQYGRQSTRRGRAMRATDAKTQKKEIKNEKANTKTDSH